MLLGIIIYEKQGKIKEAKTIIKGIGDKPKICACNNNLAWIYAENEGNVDAALPLAETAKEALPDDPSVSDTLGWIYYKKNDTSWLYRI